MKDLPGFALGRCAQCLQGPRDQVIKIGDKAEKGLTLAQDPDQGIVALLLPFSGSNRCGVSYGKKNFGQDAIAVADDAAFDTDYAFAKPHALWDKGKRHFWGHNVVKHLVDGRLKSTINALTQLK